MDSKKMLDIIKIIEEPVHGKEFYSRDMIQELESALDEITATLDINESSTQTEILEIINNYVKSTVSIRREYFDALSGLSDNFPKSEEIYRTAHAALTKNSAMCAGYAEATRILLSVYGIKSYTLISKLPETHKKLSHYVCVAEILDDNGKIIHKVLDPERQSNCEKRGKIYQEYAEAMTYCIPNENWFENKVGPTGVGLEINEYLEDKSVPRCVGTSGIHDLIEKMKGFGIKGYEEK